MKWNSYQIASFVLFACLFLFLVGTYLYEGFSYKSEYRQLSHEFIELSKLHNRLSRFINTGELNN